MSTLILNKQTLVDIADAVREKTGNDDLIAVEDLDDAVKRISGGGNSGGASDIYCYLEFMFVGKNTNFDISTVSLYIPDNTPIYEQCLNIETGIQSTPTLTSDIIDDTCLIIEDWSVEEGDLDYLSVSTIKEEENSPVIKEYLVKLSDIVNGCDMPTVSVMTYSKNVESSGCLLSGIGFELMDCNDEYESFRVDPKDSCVHLDETGYEAWTKPNTGNMIIYK